MESVAIAFIWTDRTDWGNGVEREIELAKKNGILYAPIIEEPLPTPQHFKGSPIEYMHFDPEGPLRTFSEAVGGLRKAVKRASSPN